ncbi:MAG: glycosyltransferase family 10 [Ilumatobacteraceae bacterium]
MVAPLVGLWWSDPWIDREEAAALTAGRIDWTDDLAAFETADLVVVPLPSARSLPLRRGHAAQVWALWSMESIVNYRTLTDVRLLRQYDLRMTYRFDADITIPYFRLDVFDQLQPLVPLALREPAPLSAWVSAARDRCGRAAYLGELVAAMPVDSYGRVHQTCTLPTDAGTASKLATIARYRFTAAFENSLTQDYVTEKFFQPLVMGSVPVVRGAANVAEFAPSPESYVDATLFGSAEELASYLWSMRDDEYLRFHRWRSDGSIDRWRDRWAPMVGRHPLLRLADTLPVLRLGRLAAARVGALADELDQLGHGAVEHG